MISDVVERIAKGIKSRRLKSALQFAKKEVDLSIKDRHSISLIKRKKNEYQLFVFVGGKGDAYETVAWKTVKIKG